MIYISNFYAHKREGVSNQIEALRSYTNGYLFAAGIFLEQGHLLHEDISEKRIILTESEYNRLLPGFVRSLPKDEKIHYFSEEPEPEKIKIFNSVNMDLYISMYRRPTKKYALFLKKFNNLSRVYVELESHKNLLIEYGIERDNIVVSYAPSILKRSFQYRNFTNKFLFASWNGGSFESLEGRGLIAILDLLEINKESICNVLLRDRETNLYKKIIKGRGLSERISLTNINNVTELRNAFLETDVVLFLMQKKLTKDVPNSIVDGLMLGKPVLMTDVVDFAKNIIDHDAGWVIKPGAVLDIKKIRASFMEKSKNAFAFSMKMTSSNYIKAVVSGYK